MLLAGWYGMIMNRKQEWGAAMKHNRIFWGLTAFLLLCKYAFLGLRYYPLLDDHIMYISYPYYDKSYLFFGIQNYRVRPLAAFLDIYVWSYFENHTFLLLLLITAMQFFTIYLLAKLFQKIGFSITPALVLVCLFFPLGLEATYWLAAATRIVVSMFLMAAGLWFLSQKKWRMHWLLFGLCNLLSFLFYEQVIALSFFLSLFFIDRMRCPKRYFIFPCVNLSLVGIYYIIFSNGGVNAGRSQLVGSDFFVHTFRVFREMAVCWYRGTVPLLKNGFLRGIEFLSSNIWGLLFFVLILVAAAFFGWLCSRQEKIKPPIKLFLTGLAFFIIPYLPFFLLDQISLPFRSAYPAFIGLACMVSALLSLIPKRTACVIFSICLTLFMVVNISELNDIKTVSQIDHTILENMATALKGEDLSQHSVLLLDAKWCYMTPSVSHNEHFYNLTQSDWGMTGGMRGYLKDAKVKKITPDPAILEQEPDTIVLRIKDRFQVEEVKN